MTSGNRRTVPASNTGRIRLCWSTEGVALGTRFLLSDDNVDWHPRYLEAVLAATEGDDLILDGVFGPCRVLGNMAARKIQERSANGNPITAGEKVELMRLAQIDGDVENGLVLMGQVASGISDTAPASHIVASIVTEAQERLRRT